MSTPLVYDHEAGSATPAATLEKARRSLEPSKPVLDYLLGLADRLEAESRDRIVALHRRGVRLQKAYEGDWGEFHANSGKWMSRPGYAMGAVDKRTGKSSPWYPHNKIRRYFDANTAQTLQSRIDLRVTATSDDDRSALAAEAARPLVDYYERQICDEMFVEEWDKQKRFFGQVFFFCYWDVNSGPMVDEYGVTLEDYQPGASIYTCLSCAQSGDEGDFASGACPQCGGQNLLPEEIPPMQLPTIGVVGKRPAGDCQVDIVPSLQHNFDRLASEYDQSLWYERQRRMRLEEVQAQFPWYRVPKANDTASSYDRSGIDLLEDSVGNTGGWSGRWRRPNGGDRTMLKQFWFRPQMLSDEPIPEDVPLMNGDKLPKGETLRNLYQHGMYMLLCNRDVLDIWDDRHIDHRWVQLKHIHVPNRIDGDGQEDSLRPAQEYNESRSFAVSAWKFNAARPRIIRDPLTEGDYRGQAGDIAKISGFPYEIPVSNLEHVSEAIPLDQAVIALMESADAELRDSTAAYGPVTGDPTADAGGGTGTLGGMQMLNANGNSQRMPELALVAHAYRQIFLNLIHLFRDNADEERCIPLNGEAGELAVMYLKGSDIEGDIDLIFGKGSYLPKDSQRRRANLMWLLEVGQGMVMNPQLPAKWRKALIEASEVDIDLDESTADVKNARQRIEQMKRLAPQAQQMAAMVAGIAAQIGGQDVGHSVPGGYGGGGNSLPDSPAGGFDSQNLQARQGEESGGLGLSGMGQGEQPGQFAASQSDGGQLFGGSDQDSQQSGGPIAAGSGDGFSQGYNQQQSPMTPPPPSAAELLCQMVPIDPKVDDHAVQFQFIKQWLKGDEARKCDPVVNEAMHLRLDEHENAGAMMAAMQQMTAMKANAPQMMLQQAQQGQATAQQNAQSDRQEQSKSQDREHQMLLEDKKQAGARDVASIRAQHTNAARRG
jgi:hypothetical protein